MFNKWYGRLEGDEFLKSIGRILKEIVSQKGGIAGYLNGDDFGILMPYQMSIIQEIQNEIQKKLDHLASSSGFLPAIGIYPLSCGVTSAINMYDCAVIAQAEVFGKFNSRISIYRSSMVENVENELLVISEIKNALEKEEFTFYIQPQYDILTGKINGGEALVRWQHKSKGIISPGAYIPILEKKGFIVDLDRYTWRLVCKWLREWIDRGNIPVPISINVSRVDIFLMDVVSYLENLLEEYQLSVELLHVEITENAYAENDETVNQAIERLRKKGFHVYLDDFGSGYSSLNMLSNISVDAIKLDMRFLDITEQNQMKGWGIVELIVKMARQMDIPIIIEGVERKEQEEYLREMGCRYMQGYYYYKPMSILDFEKCLFSFK